MGLAYFVREFTVFWIFLFFIYEIIFHRSLKRFLTILIGLIPIVLIGHLLYLILYHDFFYRYTSAFEKIFKANQFANFENFKTIKGIGATDKTNTFLYYTYTIFSKLGSVGFMPVTFLSLLIIKIRSNVHVHKKILFFILAFYILFEFILRYILPVPRVMNYIVFLYPLIALVLGGILVNVKFSHDSNLLRYVLSGLCILSAIILSAWISNGAYFQNMLVNQLGRYEYVQNLIFIQRVLIIISFVLCSVLFLFVRLKLQYIIPSIIVITNLLVFAPFHTFWALSRKYDMRDMYHDYLNAPMKSKIWVCMNYEGVRLEFLSNYNYHTDYPDFKPTTIGKNILHWNEHQPHLYHWDNGVHDWTKGDLLIADDKTVSEMNMRSILKSMKSYRTFSVWEIISDKPHL